MDHTSQCECEMCAGTTLDEFLDDVRRMIAEYGWQVTGVSGDDGLQPWCYSSGLTLLGHPEVAIMRLSPRQAQPLIGTVYERVKAGERFEAGKRYSGIVQGFDVLFVDADPANDDYPMNIARQFFPKLTALQLLWPDERGLFQHEPGFNEQFRQDVTVGGRSD